MSPFYIAKKVKSKILEVVNYIAPYVFPDICIVCKREIEGILCRKCNTDFDSEKGGKNSIWVNNSSSIALKLLKSWKFNYSTRARDLLLKSLEDKLLLGGDRADSEISCTFQGGPNEKGTDIIVPVPLHKRKLCERGFNQSDLIAHAISNILNAEVSNVLERKKYTTPQSQVKSKKDRIGRLKGVFCCSADVSGKKILLVDDVLTTGETTEECKRELLKAGADSVEIFALFSEDK